MKYIFLYSAYLITCCTTFKIISYKNLLNRGLHNDLSLYGAVLDRMMNQTSMVYYESDNEAQEKDESLEDIFPFQPYESLIVKSVHTDIATWKQDDPRFLDLPWPDKAGPDTMAFAKHLQWKRSLSDGERVRWQKWAVYERFNSKEKYDYSLEDHVFQRLLNQLDNKIVDAAKQGNDAEVALWHALSNKYNQDEETRVRATVKAFYSAINRQNYDNIHSLWLPDEKVEILLPGYNKQTGHQNVVNLWKRIVKDTKAFSTIKSDIVKITLFGYIAVVHVVETIEEGFGFKTIKRKGADTMTNKKDKRFKKVLSTIVLRKYNMNWRFLTHHAVRFSTSAFTGDEVSFRVNKSRKQTKSEEERNEFKGNGVTTSMNDLFKSNSPVDNNFLSVVRRLNEKGEWERVIVDSSAIEINKNKNLNSMDKVLEVDEDSLVKMKKSGNPIDAFNRIINGGIFDKGANDLTKASEELESNEMFSISKRAVQAVRALWKAGSINKNQKDVLLGDIISKVTSDKTSVVESAFELLVMKGGLERPARLKDRRAMDEDGLEEFAEQCIMLVEQLETQNEDDENEDENEEDENED